MTAKRFKFNGMTNCIEYDNKSILLDSNGDKIEELLNELYEEAKDNEHYHSEVLRLYIAVSEENEQLRIKIRKLRLGKIHQNKENEQLKESVYSWSKSYNRVYEENTNIKHTIKTMIKTERTELGKSILKQLWEQIE